MEDARQPVGQVLNVERGVEWSRLEEQIVVSVYERLVPVVGVVIRPVHDAGCRVPRPEETAKVSKRAMGA